MRSVPRQFRRLAIASVAGVAALGGVIATAGPSSADISAATIALSGAPTTVLGGTINQPVTGWTLMLPTSLATGDRFQFIVNPNGVTAATLDCQGANVISFAHNPVASDSQNPGLLGGSDPTFTTSLSTEPGTESACTTLGIDNVLTITVISPGNSGLFGPTVWTVPVSAVSYNVGVGAALGPVTLTDSNRENGNATIPSPDPSGVPSNATVTDVAVTSNNPPIGMAVGNDVDTAISPISLRETVSGTVHAQYTCVTLLNGGVFNTVTHTPTVTSSGGASSVNAVVGHPAPATLAFNVTAASTSGTATYTLGNLFVDGGNTVGPAFFSLTTGATASCASGISLESTGDRAFGVYLQSRTSGIDADATAAAEMEAVFPPPSCPGTAASRTVVLATDENFPDALSASYLAGRLNTGLLLTPSSGLSSETAAALRIEGITNVDVVGGPQAVSTDVINTLSTTPIYNCGGLTPVTPLTGMTVTVIAGQTQYDTSSLIAQYFGSSGIGLGAFPGAYLNYNDTTGASSVSGSSTPVPTAILATGVNFEDATSASVVAYAQHFPVVLTTPDTLASAAAASLENDQIKQVILVGGPAAVSDNVVAQVQALGITVLRIAGSDYSDTAQQLARFELNSGSSIINNLGPEGLGWDLGDNNAVVMARGDFYSDGLAGAPFAALVAGSGLAGHPEPILLTLDPNNLGSALTGFFNAGGSDSGVFGDDHAGINAILVVGGAFAVTTATVQAALNALSMG